MDLPIYFDYAATTPLDPKVLKKMLEYLDFNHKKFGNPASRSHKFGWIAEEAVDLARQEIASFFNADYREIIFTSGATESNNLAIKGCANFYKKKGIHIITCKTEHKSVLDSCRYLEENNFHITYLTPQKNGIISLEAIKKAIRPSTILISIMHVNNEIGVIQDIQKISEICKKNHIFFHVDATQSIGKIHIDIQKIHVDLLSFSAHKIYGPKGIGGLYVRRKPRIRLKTLIHGGGHERGLRSGTLPVHQIVGMGKAFQIIKNIFNEENKKITQLKNYFWKKLQNIKEIYLNSDPNYCIPHILNVSFNFIEGESLIMAIKDLAVSSGSACTSSSLEPSYVLSSLGIRDDLAHSSIRFSIGRFTTKEEIDYAYNIIQKAVIKLRNLSPLWEMYEEGIDINTIKWEHN
ncbi:IscS subfamily cysteine desulfurase [Buchnera aphidicola (Thelaxes californica)]|uniref:Cysteine desulfurase IscS n=1 Tax=Buchnera aphidicola (Thelaxes californica) TaxID=1315998 RepID=A0A4D6YK16_9GAMM|nr:IscS subfamily cysteine desulfurase [Buchnera aphidicola]QCI26981.1 IscS subfamily cysteine desulfurase [Buchnera aphidicola (Thelaxes californica)]